jgi:hypothetical protein
MFRCAGDIRSRGRFIRTGCGGARGESASGDCCQFHRRLTIETLASEDEFSVVRRQRKPDGKRNNRRMVGRTVQGEDGLHKPFLHKHRDSVSTGARARRRHRVCSNSFGGRWSILCPVSARSQSHVPICGKKLWARFRWTASCLGSRSKMLRMPRLVSFPSIALIMIRIHCESAINSVLS